VRFCQLEKVAISRLPWSFDPTWKTRDIKIVLNKDPDYFLAPLELKQQLARLSD
jgi:hypothetical protein